jgi:hypothetical protein
MEYKTEERARHAKVTRKIKLIWGVISGSIAALFLLFFILALFRILDETHNEITKSTKSRKPLAVDRQISAQVNSGRLPLLTDNYTAYKVVYNVRDWNIAAADFFEKTGVLIHFRTEDSGQWLTQPMLEEAYREAFDDDAMTGPFMLLMLSAQADTNWRHDTYAYICGDAAAGLIDMEAGAIIEDCVRSAYTFASDTYRSGYPGALAYAAGRIMSRSVAPSTVPSILLFAVVIPGLAVFFVLRRKRYKKDEEIHKLLNTDLDELVRQVREDK